MVGASEKDYASFALGDIHLQRGGVLRQAFIAYKTYGHLNKTRDNCVLLPTYYTGTHRSYAAIIGPSHVLNPDRYFIVIPNMFGNGVSTSPSLMIDRTESARFPKVTVYDNVLCQHRLLIEHLEVERIALTAGWSLGAIQSYHWAAMFPDMVSALLPYCGGAKCWPLNTVFLEGVRAALCADSTFREGLFESPPIKGLRAFARCYVGWAYSGSFFRDRLYRNLGYQSLAAFLESWEDEHLSWDANDLLTMLWTWQDADLGSIPRFAGDFAAALRSIRARTIVMPCDQDSYFTLEENKLEAALLSNAELRPFYSPYGHCAGAPGRFQQEAAFLERAMHDLLIRSP